MPSIFQKEKVLDGRGDVLSYKKDPLIFFYREWIPARRAYRSKKIQGAKTLDDARILAVDVAFEFASRPPVEEKSAAALDKKQRTLYIDIAVDNFLSHEKERVEAGIIKYSTYRGKEITLLKHLIPYLKEQGVIKTRQINESTFNNYLIFRKGARRPTCNNEIIHIKDFLSNWLLKYRLVDHYVVTGYRLFPMVKIKEEDLLSNPAITKKDWLSLIAEIDKWVHEGLSNANHRVHLWRMLFRTFVLVAKNSGARPEELMKLKWKDIEVIDIGQMPKLKSQEVIEELQVTGFDALVSDVDVGFDALAPNFGDSGSNKCLIAYINLISGKTGQSREIPTNLGSVIIRWKDYVNSYCDSHGLNRHVSSNDLLFGNINNEGRPYVYHNFIKSWRTIRSLVASTQDGRTLANKAYTIYSMRSTFIESKLLAGLDIFLLSRISGQDPKILFRYYQRIKLRGKAEAVAGMKPTISARCNKVGLFAAEA